jgi:hypothetical protein
MKLSDLIPIVLAIVLVVSLLAVWYYPTIQSYMESNRMWNGIKDFSNTFETQNIESFNGLSNKPEDEVLVSIPYEEYSTDDLYEMGSFLNNGHTILLMDDFGYGNTLLAYLGATIRFSHELLLDPLFCYKNPAMPRITDFAPEIIENNIDVIVLNHASTLDNVTSAEKLAWSSGDSFLDSDNNGVYSDGETKGPFAIAAEIQVGQGHLLLMSDPSIMINAMVERDDNYGFIRYLTSFKEETPALIIDQQHLSRTPLDISKVKLDGARKWLANPYVLAGIVAIAIALVAKYTLKKGESLG